MERKSALVLTIMGVLSSFPWISTAQLQSPASVGQQPPLETPKGSSVEGRRGFFPMKPESEVQSQSSELEQSPGPELEDAEVIAMLGNERLSRGEVRVLSLWLRQSDPDLSPEDAFHRAMFITAFELTMYAEATKRGLIVSLDQAIKVRDQQKQICDQYQECIEATTLMATGLGMSEVEYWSAERCQRALTITQMNYKILAESGLRGEQQSPESLQKWQQQVLKEAPIRWLDPKLEQEFPDIITNMKPVNMKTVIGSAGFQNP